MSGAPRQSKTSCFSNESLLPRKLKQKQKIEWGGRQNLDGCIVEKLRILEDTKLGLSSDI